MSFTRIVPYNDHDDATLTASATEASGFAVEETQNDLRDHVYRSVGTSSVSITGVLSASRTASAFFLFRHTAHGGNVRLQLYSDAGATAQVYDSTALPAVWYTDSDPYVWSTGTNDPFKSESPYRLFFAATEYRSYKITFGGTPTASYWQVSRIVLGKYLELARQPKFGLSQDRADLTDRNRSMGGSLRTNFGASWRTLTADLGKVNDNERATWDKIKRQVGTGRSFAISVYPGDGTDLERDYTMLVKFATLDPLVRDMRLYTQRLQLEET